VTRKHRATFRFRSTDIGHPRFKCKLDRRPRRACGPRKTYRHLKRGRHILRVRATDLAGNVERRAARYRWRVR
jgi:hypothetical protein